MTAHPSEGEIDRSHESSRREAVSSDSGPQPTPGETEADDLPADEPGGGPRPPSPGDHRSAAALEGGGAAAPGSEASPTSIAYCVRCGAAMAVTDVFCHACGWDTRSALPAVRRETNPSEKSRLAALLLCVLLGWLGAHRFYAGKIGTGIIWLVTLGFMGIGVIYDLVIIATGEFRDGDGRRVVAWEWQ